MSSGREDELARALQMRRSVLGDEYVNAQTGDPTEAGRDFQETIMLQAWSIWLRPGLKPRDRSMLVMAMTAAMGRLEEFELHYRASVNAGVLDTEVDELVLQVAAYCGAPAGLSARRVVRKVRAERGE